MCIDVNFKYFQQQAVWSSSMIAPSGKKYDPRRIVSNGAGPGFNSQLGPAHFSFVLSDAELCFLGPPLIPF